MWKAIKGYEGLYEINEYGDIKTLDKYRGNVFVSERMIKPDISGSYKRVTLTKNKKHKRYSVHRLVYENFIGELKKDMQINHIDYNKMNNHFSNLEQVTPLENSYHSKGNNSIKLSLKDVDYIKNSDLSNNELSKMFKIHTRSVTRVRNGERWKPNQTVYGNTVPSLNIRKV